MTTVTVSKAYFDALLRRAQFHTSGHEFELTPDLLSNIIVSKAEHDYLRQSSRDYTLLKSALFRGGLTTETLKTLLMGESEAVNDNTTPYEYSSENTFVTSRSAPINMIAPHGNESPPTSDDIETGSDHLDLPQRRPLRRACSHKTESCLDNYSEEEEEEEEEIHRPESQYRERIPVHDRRTILIGNLADRTTHKDLAGIIRGGRVLDIFLRSDRSATVSFVEGAEDFLAYVKRNDVYLHAKRLDFRWADRQFRVPPHVSYKIAGGASRNFIVRGIAGRVNEDQIRDHLDHIHNLVVVDITFKNGDAHISTNSIHNALFARTCMMSRSTYKGTRIDWASDECALPLPQLATRTRMPAVHASPRPLTVVNTYALLDTGSDIDSDSQTEPYMSNGICLNHNDWANTAVA